MRKEYAMIHDPRVLWIRFDQSVNFFQTPCIIGSSLVNYYVACYIFIWEVIFLNYHYGHMVRILHWCPDQSMTSALEKMELTAAQGHIMGYLAHQKQAPCPRDIEAEFQLSHPTVSGLLSRLEQKGFIQLRTDPDDRRCKRVYILEKGQLCHDLMHQTIFENETRIVQGFTPEEQEQFGQLLQRAITNMGGGPCRSRSKEEDKE